MLGRRVDLLLIRRERDRRVRSVDLGLPSIRRRRRRSKIRAMTSPFVSPVSSVFPSAENATDTGRLPGYSTV